MKKLKVVVYCRIVDKHMRDLLDYQEQKLTDLLGYFDTQVIEVVKEVSRGLNFCSYGMQKLIHYIINEQIDAVIVYDNTRVAIYDDLLVEFKMICDMHNIEVFDMSDLVTMIFTNSILESHDK